ncbi:hypothetical protein PFLUV_G00149840 [Perca fluviatilis]|uniref:TNFR-Cys domain-containing protein n=1 Tax=Perca fluviatilis TaxID=8168 RepID=A0A6A5EXM0_PERFL|nr:hypothetical protein PFLUV_G00149840 [Perca fluviatilis]
MVLLKLLILTLTFYELIVDLDAQTCPKEKGSVVKENCTKVKNSQCQCRGRFVPSKSDSSICKCDIGFGLEDTECLMCNHGYFSTQTNSPCEKWRGCKSGVKIPGTRTSDVICNPELNPNDITPPTSDKNVSLIAWLTPPPPRLLQHTQAPQGPPLQTHATTLIQVWPSSYLELLDCLY